MKYRKLEFQGPTGPSILAFEVDFARFARKQLPFKLAIHPYIIVYSIVGWNISNICCFLDYKIFSPTTIVISDVFVRLRATTIWTASQGEFSLLISSANPIGRVIP